MKLFSKIATLALGAAMAVGVGVAVGSKRASEAKADYEAIATFDFSSSTPSGSTSTGLTNDTIKTLLNDSSSVSNLVTSVTGLSGNVYSGKGSGGEGIPQNVLKVGKAGGGGAFTMTIGGSDNISKVEFTCYGWKDISSFSINSSAAQKPTTAATQWTPSFELATASKSLAFSVTTSAVCITSFTIYKTSGVGPTPTEKHDITFNANAGTDTVTGMPETLVDQEGTVSLSEVSSPSRDDYNFMGWSLTSTGEIVESVTIQTSDIELFAIWQEKTSTEYVETELTEGKLLITTSWDSKTYYMPTDEATGSGPLAVEYQDVSEINPDNLWTVSKDGDNWVFQNDDGKYMWASSNSANNGIRVNDGPGSWAVQSNGSLKNPNYDRFLGVYNGADWRSYNSATASNYKESATSLKFYRVGGEPVTQYEVIDRIDFGSLNKSSVAEGATLNVTIVPDSGYSVPESLTYVYMSGSPVAYTYANGVVTVQNVSGNITIEGTCVKFVIQDIYSVSSGSTVEFDGYYAGSYSDGSVVMDGAYGVLLYHTNPETAWEADKTVLHVVGEVSIYKNLYEVSATSVSVQTDSSVISQLSKPEDYTLTGSESSANLTIANRRTFVSGELVSCAVASVTNYNVVINDGTKDLTLYLKSADNVEITLKDESKTTISAYLTSKQGETVTIKGYTSFFTDFQVRVCGIVEVDEDYTAEDFAEQLLSETDAVCVGYDGIANNKEALVEVWNHLGGEERWQALSATQQQILIDTNADEEGTTVEQAMARYDYLTGKYGLNNFIAGRTPASFANIAYYDSQVTESSTSVTIIVIVAVASMTLLGVTLVLRKRKHQ